MLHMQNDISGNITYYPLTQQKNMVQYTQIAGESHDKSSVLSLKGFLIMSTTSNVSSLFSADFYAGIEKNLRDGMRVTVKNLATHSGVSIAKMRGSLITHFGNRISFSKGRTGGISIR